MGTVYAASVVIDASGNVQPGGSITRIDTERAQVFTDAKEIGLGQSLAVAGLVTTEPTYFWNDGSLINAKLPKTSGVQNYPGTAVPNTMILVDYTEMQVYCVVHNADSQVELVDFALTPSPGYLSSRTIFSTFAPTGFRIGNGSLYAIQNGVETVVDLANNSSTMNQTPIPGDNLPAFTDLTARTADGLVFLASNEGVWFEKDGVYDTFLNTTYGTVTQVEVSGKNLLALEVDPATNVATLVEAGAAGGSGETVLATDVTASARFAFDSVNVYFISADQTRVQHVAM